MSDINVRSGGIIDGSNLRFQSRNYHPENGTLLGFWLYLMSDCLVFTCLFAAYAVLGRNYAGGPTGTELFDLKLVAINTAILLASSITYGLAMLEIQRRRKFILLSWLAVTCILGLCFIWLESYEFLKLVSEGNGPQRSGFLSSFFMLVATHGLHVAFGIIWLVTLMLQIRCYGLTPENSRRLMCLSMFWHFLDVIWIGVFTFVYLMGVLP